MRIDGDIAVIGSGFGGTLTALILQKLDLRPVLIDRASHPRFIIGESSTPIADLVWHDLCERYELSHLAPLSKYGSWQKSFPELPCGLKRGFSYFHHRTGQPFQTTIDHRTELLVAASNHNDTADTHWYRPTFDEYLVKQAIEAHIPVLDKTEITEVQEGDEWVLQGHRAGEPVRVTARFVVDASGEGAFLPRRLKLRDEVNLMRTQSRAVFGHFTNVDRWEVELGRSQIPTSDHPFPCDDAALHHVFEGGWMYVLRFNQGITSAGFLLDMNHFPLDLSISPEDEWRRLLQRFPAIERQFAHARTTPLCGPIRRTGRLQRRWGRLVGDHWALLPFTAYGLDALHSTGNAHTLRGIERLCDILSRRFGRDELSGELREYEQTLKQEINLLDLIVSGSYQTFGNFEIFSRFSMAYFAGAIFSEVKRRQGKADIHSPILQANDPRYVRIVNECLTEAQRLISITPLSHESVEAYRKFVKTQIGPYNLAGLCDPQRNNMYPYLD